MSRNRFSCVNVGPTGAGKTYTVTNFILPYSDGPVYILDPQHEYDFDNAVIFEGENDPNNNPVREFMQYVRGAWIEGKYPKMRYLIVRPDKHRKGLQQAQGMDLLRRLAAGRFPGTLVVDETAKWSNSRKAVEPLHDIAMYGGHYGGQDKGLSLIACARRISHIGKDLTGNADITILFRQTETIDINRAKEAGFDKHKVRNLTGHEYLINVAREVPFLDALDPA